MNGTGKGSFSPASTASRASVITILYRLEGTPTVSGTIFQDVAQGKWYSDGISWAAETGLAGGDGKGNFRPNDAITREQVVTILYRYATMKGYDVSIHTDLTSYSDANRISGYAKSPMAWANAVGILQGRSNGSLDPKGTTTRAELAVMLMRFCKYIEQT